jgi:predicted DNA-binding protein
MTKGMSDRPTYSTVGTGRTVQESIKLSLAHIEAIKEIAEKKGLTKSEIYRKAIESYISEHESIVDIRIKETTLFAKDLINQMEHLGKIKKDYIDGRKLKEKELINNKKVEEEHKEKSKSEMLLNDMMRIQEHLNGGTPPEPDYRKLPKGELNPELLDFYNKNIGVLK